jgi:hypothetical protein
MWEYTAMLVKIPMRFKDWSMRVPVAAPPVNGQASGLP